MPRDILKDKKFTIGFDPHLFTKKTIEKFFGGNSCKFKSIEKNLIDKIWKRNNKLSKSNFINYQRNLQAKVINRK